MTNAEPQIVIDGFTNPWNELEDYLLNTVVKNQEKEVYIIAGRDGQDTTVPLLPERNGYQVSVPSHVWKVVLIMDKPGLGIQDVTENTVAFAVDIPNTDFTAGVPWDDYIVSVNDLEDATGYDFLSNIPKEIQEIIEDNEFSLSAPLMAETEEPNISSAVPGTDFKTSIWHSSIPEKNTISLQNIYIPGINQISSNQISSAQVSKGQIGTPKTSITQISSPQIGFSQTSPFETSISEVGIDQISISKVGLDKPSTDQISADQARIAQITPVQMPIIDFGSHQIDASEIGSLKRHTTTKEFDSNKNSFPSSIEFEQFFPSNSSSETKSVLFVHDSTPEIINVLNNTATNIWSDLLQPSTQLDINFQITDLPSGRLAEATITDFDDSGKPKAGTIEIDHNANGVGWFIDETPLDNSEFTVHNTDSFLLAAAESEANGKYDLLTTVLHELAHLYGFIDGYQGFDARVETENGTTKFIGDDFEAVLDGEHLDKQAHPNDLMNTHLAPGIRKLPSELNVQILQTLIATELEQNGNNPAGEELLAALSSDPLLAISNGDFSISDTTTDSFAWDTRGASGIESGQAVLTEDSPFLSNFTQTFTVPETAKTIQFKLIGAELGASELLPADAFEVALLDADSNESLSTEIGMTETDSLLNIQNDGTAYFNDKVRISGATSGEIIELDKSRTVTVDISNLTPGTEATLFFDLLGFGYADSRVIIDDVRLSDQFLLPPVANDDAVTILQGDTATIDVLANDTDEDGTLATDSVTIQTEPTNGTVTVNDDGTVDYTPGDRTIGEDSFSCTVTDNDAQTSEAATVRVTVENAVPEISEVQIPENIIEGDEITIKAIASDAGNNELTYTWEFDNDTTLYGRFAKRLYEDNGTYSGTVTVTDTHGGSDTQAFEVVVNNAAPVVDIGVDQTIDEGSNVNFAGSFTDAGIEDTHTVAWDFGDGSSVDTAQASHVYTDDGTYTATFSVTDNDGAVSSGTITVTVNNVAPTITSLTTDDSLFEGAAVSFNTTATDPGDDTLTYTWDFGDGSDTVTGANTTHTYADNGNYTVTLTVADEDGGETSQTIDITVDNVAPSFTEVNGKTEVNEGEAVEYSAAATDPGADELTYSWNFGERPRADERRKGTRELGDGTPEVDGANATHSFANNGTYDATVTATDDDGAATTSNLTITVNNVAPTIETEATKSGSEGTPVGFTANFNDPGNDDLSITWDFGDGSDVVTTDYSAIADNTYTESLFHTYTQNGTYTATVTVTDSDGAVTESTVQVAIANTAPVITSLTGDTNVNEGDLASFNAVATDAGREDTLTYTWDFGDGSETTTGTDATHTYTDNGDYTVTLTVTDGDGGETVQTLPVTVSNVAPSFTKIDGKTTVDEGEAVDYSATATDPGDDELTYTWNFGDGTPEVAGKDVTHTFANNGIYDATVTVRDDDGASTVENITITVNNVAPTLDTETTKTGNEGTAVGFEATFDDVGNDELTVTWDFGDGSEVVSTNYTADSEITTETQTHTYTADGLYTATVTVTDSDGAVTESTVQVAIANVAPIIETLTGDTEIEEGDTATFKAIARDAGDDTLTYTWDFGDGSETATGADATHTYTDNGNYTVTLTVTDGDGGETIQTRTVTVNNVAPTFDEVNGKTEVNEGEAVDYNATTTDPGDDELTYSWNFGDGTPEVYGADATHSFANNGTYDVTITATDDDGASTVENITITVNNVAPTLNTAATKTGDEGTAVDFEAIFGDPGDDDLTITWGKTSQAVTRGNLA